MCHTRQNSGTRGGLKSELIHFATTLSHSGADELPLLSVSTGNVRMTVSVNGNVTDDWFIRDLPRLR
jgi:hypothetical protein